MIRLQHLFRFQEKLQDSSRSTSRIQRFNYKSKGLSDQPHFTLYTMQNANHGIQVVFQTYFRIIMTKVDKKQARQKLLFAETLAGIITGFLVSPTNVVMDKSVMQYANKAERSIWTAAGKTFKSLFVSPIQFLTAFEFRWQCFVYFPTYAVGNLADHFDLSPDVPRPIQKLLAVFLTNTGTSLIRDRIYTIRLNPYKKVEPFPAKSLSLFFIRDIIAMASAFTLPPIVGRQLSQKYGIEYKNGQRIAQLFCPLLVQVFATPIHLLALGFYNNKSMSLSEQFGFIRKLYFNTLAMRGLRFLPAYGIGGICNIELRKWTKSKVPFE